MPIINQIVKGSGGSAPAHYIEKTVDANGVLQNSTSVIDLTGVTDISDYALQYAYYSNLLITGAIDLSSITTISGINALTSCFFGCTHLSSTDLGSLKLVSGNSALSACFQNCTGITSVNLGSLEVVSSGVNGLTGCFSYCSYLTSIDLSFLTSLTGTNALNGLFRSCSSLASVDLSSLTKIYGSGALSNCFAGCSSLQSLSFPAITTTSFGTNTNQFGNMCSGITGIVLHFPSNVQTQVEALAGYSTTTPFGSVSGTVLFDLPATVTLTGADTINYERNPKEDTQTALAWRKVGYDSDGLVVDWTPFYTSGTTDPQVNDTIYSDSACTTAVTTISSIA